MRTLWSDASRIVKGVAVVIAAAAALAAMPALHAEESAASESKALVNSARAAVGVPALASDSRLDAIAGAQAQRMADRDAIYHNPNLQSDADAAGVDWQWIGENVGVGPDVQSIHDGFMASPGHHENIVYGNYNVIGVGTATGKDGSMFVAQVFAGLAPKTSSSSSSSSSPASASSKPATTTAAAPASTPASDPRAAAAPTVTRSLPARSATVAAAIVVPQDEVNVLLGGVVDGAARF